MGSLKFFDLGKLKRECNAYTFIETGTGYGHGVDYAATFDFRDIYSIEIYAEIVKKLAPKYEADKRIKLINATSIEGLSLLLPSIDTNIIFFLDSHFPAADVGAAGFGDEKNEDLRLPLLTELALIKQLRINFGYKDIILVDDIMFYDDENNDKYEGSDWKQKLDIAPRKNQNCYREILSYFGKTHTSELYYNENGFVIFKPRG